MGALVRHRIWYSIGNEHKPSDPFGRYRLVLEVDGRARLDHYSRGNGHEAWTARVKASALDSLWSALEQSGFPKFPFQILPAGASLHDLAIGPGPASAESAYIYVHEVPEGYAEVFSIISAAIRQTSDPNDATPADARHVEDVASIDPSDTRFMIPPSPGSAFLLAYLSAKRVTQAALCELLARHAMTHEATDAEQKAANGDASWLCGIGRSLLIDVPRPPGDLEGTTQWLRDIAASVRPRLTDATAEDAWRAGEAARLVAVCTALVASVEKLPRLASEKSALARDLEESVAALRTRLDMMRSPLVDAQSQRLGGGDDVHALMKDIARALDGVPPKKEKPNIDRFLAMKAFELRFEALDDDTLEALALQKSDGPIAKAALAEAMTRTKDVSILHVLLGAKPWDAELTAYALESLAGRNLDVAIRYMFDLLGSPELAFVVVETIASIVAANPDRFTWVNSRGILRMLLARFSKIEPSDLKKPELVETVRALDRKATELGR